MMGLPTRKAAMIAGVIVALIYTLVAGFSIPSQRTFYMLLVFAIALLSGRQILFCKS
jgi:competence protein ComEC